VSLSIEVRLVERLNDRARVEVKLTPSSETRVDGVAVELFTGECEPLGHRVVLPIAGALTDAVVVRAEVRASGGLPPRAVIVATAWRDETEVRAWCPADPWTAFEAHVRGKRCVQTRVATDDDDVILESLTRRQQVTLGRSVTWLAPKAACKPCAAVGPFDVHTDERDAVDELTDELGLDARDAHLLRELLEERD
jgi:hypothetical protein